MDWVYTKRIRTTSAASIATEVLDDSAMPTVAAASEASCQFRPRLPYIVNVTTNTEGKPTRTIATSPLPFSISSATTDALPSGLILAYTPSGAILTWCATTTAVARQPPVMKLPSMPISYNVRIVRADECLCKREDGQWGRCGRRDGDANQRAAFLRFELPQALRTYGNPARRNGPTGSTRYTSAARW
ncbi:hypothetical protein EI94DRAFT_128713 [Lactarius quietus]|nr:hypothetical protein EI94DRAFT_128713 [Lactarius quietus]